MPDSLHTAPVRTFIRERPRTCGLETPVAEVAVAMASAPSRAVIVLGPTGAPVGIVTDSDIRSKLVARRRDPAATTAREVMSTPLVSLPDTAFAFEALLEMTRRAIHHLVVVGDDGCAWGVVTSDDLVGLPASHPVLLARAIADARTLPELAELAGRITELVSVLVAQRSRARDIAAIVAELNDRIVGRVLTLSEATVTERCGVRPPGPYAWLLFGSEGRREQTLRTDQDNGLVYSDGADNESQSWFSALARDAIDGLVAVGFPQCPAGAMASNPPWCQPLAVWEGYFRDWMEHPTPSHALAASMYFDLRPLQAADPFALRLRALIREEVPRHPHLLSAMARDVVDRRLPRTILGQIKTARRGPHRGMIDVKGAGSLQLVAAARIHALELGLPDTSTVSRFHSAAAAGIYDPTTTDEVVEAFDHLLQVRLAAQLERLAAGMSPDNWIDPKRLSPSDRLLLRAAFDTVTRVQNTLRDRYRTDLFG